MKLTTSQKNALRELATVRRDETGARLWRKVSPAAGDSLVGLELAERFKQEHRNLSMNVDTGAGTLRIRYVYFYRLTATGETLAATLPRWVKWVRLDGHDRRTAGDALPWHFDRYADIDGVRVYRSRAVREVCTIGGGLVAVFTMKPGQTFDAAAICAAARAQAPAARATEAAR